MEKVSVIVPTKNSEEFLALCLHNIENQTYPNFEIIVVDNWSTDNTREIAWIYANSVFLFGPERANQDNLGILAAKGEYIWLTGSDMRADKNYIEQAVNKLNEGYDAVYASVLTDWQVKHFWGKVKALERRLIIGDNTKESARFFKKSVWEELGRYDENLVGVEEDFQHRLDDRGFKTGRITAREYHLHEERNLKEVFKKSAYYGKFSRHYLKKHKLKGVLWLFPIHLQQFKRIHLLLIHPILAIGLIVYKIIQYAGGLYGIRKSQSRAGRGS